jgi:hypothetical protein
MSDATQPTEEAEALEVCRRLLAEDPDADYKFIRREAWSDGIKITRAVFSTVLRELHGEPEPEPRARRASRHEADLRPAAPRAPARAEEGAGPRPGGQISPWTRSRDGRGAEPQVRDREGGRERPLQDAEPSRERSPRQQARQAWDTLFTTGPSADLPPGSPLAPPAQPKGSAVEFMADYLRQRSEAPYKEVRQAAEAAGYTVSSATYGRAQAIVGLIEPDHDSRPPPIRPKPVSLPAPPSRDVESPMQILDRFVAAARGMDQERGELRIAIQSMLKVVRRALEAD